MGQLKTYLTEFPRVQEGPKDAVKPEPIDWKALHASLEIDRRVKALPAWTPGTRAAFEMLHGFIRSRLHHFATKRNDPNQNYISGLSPYLHFGQIAPQRCALEVSKYRGRYSESVASFIEELVVRRELSDNHCFYNERYDSIDGASAWARESLLKHVGDPRTHLYTLGEFEFGCTHDPLWNASQHQMVSEGKLHGFLRMYWCKKILEWTSTPQLALSTSLYLNDRYNLDGRDPNGYVGCAWSILGIHDMGWTERPVFGKIRYINFDGCKRKFKVADFIAKYAK
jgi:deoxyribodipyrimidine photo-lyase